MDLVDDIATLFERHGHQAYEGLRRESVDALAHALQTAQLAEWAQADGALVLAALLHDIGHFIADASLPDDADDGHELHGAHWLAQGFGPAVVEPVRLHVQAKRYLVATDPRYADSLSEASVHSLRAQGGPMTRDECRRFEALPFADGAVLLRRWDDSAKTPGKRTPPLEYYLALARELQLDAEQPRGFVRTVVGSFDA
jgi:phosphonate degradation associated HDIG domain protein